MLQAVWSIAFRREKTEIGRQGCDRSLHSGRAPRSGGLQEAMALSWAGRRRRASQVKGTAPRAKVRRKENMRNQAVRPAWLDGVGGVWVLR